MSGNPNNQDEYDAIVYNKGIYGLGFSTNNNLDMMNLNH